MNDQGIFSRKPNFFVLFIFLFSANQEISNSYIDEYEFQDQAALCEMHNRKIFGKKPKRLLHLHRHTKVIIVQHSRRNDRLVQALQSLCKDWNRLFKTHGHGCFILWQGSICSSTNPLLLVVILA